MFSIHAVAMLSNDAYKWSVNFSAIFTVINPVFLPSLIFFQTHCIQLLLNVPGVPWGLGALGSFIARLAFGFSWTLLTRDPFRPQCPLSSLGARRPFAFWFPYVTFVSTWSCGSLRTGRSRNACWPRGSRVSRHTWNSWRAKAGAITTRPICWKLLSALHVQRKQRFYFILMIDTST